MNYSENDSSDEEDLMAVTSVFVLYKMLKRRQKLRRQYLGWRNRRWWVRPLNLRMQEVTGGEYENVYQQLKSQKDDYKFFKYTRMTFDQWAVLLNLVTPSLQKRHKRGFSPERDLVITMRYFVTGNHFCDLALSFGCGESTVASVVRRTCSAIVQLLKPSQLPYPTESDYHDIMKTFWIERQMPNCCGAIDGKHITVMAPPHHW